MVPAVLVAGTNISIEFHRMIDTRLMGKIMNPQNTGLIKYIIELDDGKIETGTPIKFDGKNHGFPVKIFSTKALQ